MEAADYGDDHDGDGDGDDGFESFDEEGSDM